MDEMRKRELEGKGVTGLADIAISAITDHNAHIEGAATEPPEKILDTEPHPI